MTDFDAVVIGGGAAGLFCAAVAGQRGRRVLVIEHTRRVGRKILMSGGGRCNFTNMESGPEHFLCANPHFHRAALARYTPWDFIALVSEHGIPWHEKKLGQLFCDHKARAIVDMLLAECARGDVTIATRCPVDAVEGSGPYRVRTGEGTFRAPSVVVATGGLSIPRMGATDFGHRLARERGIPVRPTRAALVPFTLDREALALYKGLAGTALDSLTRCGERGFRENLLFTHRGLSGPAALQISSYWREGDPLTIDLDPEGALESAVARAREERPGLRLRTLLGAHLTRRVARCWAPVETADVPVGRVDPHRLDAVLRHCREWTVHPAGTEGYATAEVTLGGVDTDALTPTSLEARDHPGLYFIGEVVDVTGHLGGHNFQWAWASAHAAGVAL